jgi:nucleoside-diphosphate-sugar epimerase
LLRHVYAGDVVRFLLRILGDAATHGQAYNVCHDEMVPLHELIGLLADLMGARPRLVDVALAAIEGAGLDVKAVSPFTTRWTSRLDPTRAREALGFRPRPLRDALDVIVRSFLAHLPDAPPDGYAGRAAEIRIASGPKA